MGKLSYQPHHHVVVEHLVFKFKFLFRTIFVNEGCLYVSLLFRIELVYLHLFCKVNSMLLQSIFFPRSPLHDGAVLIRDNRIVAARVILPLPRGKISLNTRIGTRHRAAIGITEESDADVVVVSEETGRISFVKGGKVTPINNINELKLLLGASFGEE